MRRYRTEIVIPPDRSVTLQLPASLPDGRATLIVQIEEPHDAEATDADEADRLEGTLDHDDIEWWEEFEDEGDDASNSDDDPADPGALPSGLVQPDPEATGPPTTGLG